MTTFLTFTILGLVLGAVYAIAASGLVLTYKTSGIFNFAHGAQAMLGAFLYWQLNYAWGWPTWLALVVVLGIVGPAMGWLLHSVLMKGLRDTTDVTKIVVTVAVLLGAVYLSQWIWHPEDARVTEMFFGSDAKIAVFGVAIRVHEIICLAAAAAIALGLRLLFTRSRIGVAMRAAVDDPDLLRLNGHDPERIAALSWAMGSMLAVLAGILITPVSGGALEANALTLLVIDAFAAAIFGRLRSIPRTFLGAMVLGLTATYVLAYFPSAWAWTGNLRASLPMILLFVVLIVLPQDRLRAAAVRTRERYRVPSVRQALGWGLALVAIVYLLKLLMVDSAITTFALGMTFAIIALSLTVLTGYAGEVNLAPLSFGALATVAVFHFGITGTGLAARLNPQGVLLAIAVTTLIGGLVALPALRLRGLYLALATMAFGVFVSSMVLRATTEHTLFGVTFALFPDGALVVPPLKVGPLDLRDGDTLLMSTTALFAVLGIGLVALRNSGYGRRLAAMKDSPAASAMLGESLLRLKLSVFMLSAAIASLGGILMSSTIGSVAAEHFTIMASLALVMLTVVAGIGYISGALFGGLVSGVGFVIIVGTFNDLAMAHPEAAAIHQTIASLATVSTALIGMGVGSNPSGLVHVVMDSYRSLRDAKPVLVAGAVFEAVLYALTLAGVVDNWWFAILTGCLVLMLPVFARMLMPEAVLSEDQLARRRRTPPELIGVDVAYTEQAGHELDREFGLTGRDRRPSGERAEAGSEKGGVHATG